MSYETRLFTWFSIGNYKIYIIIVTLVTEEDI